MNPDQKFTNLTPYKFPQFDYPPTLAELHQQVIAYAGFLETQHISSTKAWQTALAKVFATYQPMITTRLDQSQPSFNRQMNDINSRSPRTK